MTKFNLSIDLFTPDVADAVDVAQALRSVADRLVKFTSLPWSPYALEGKIYAQDSKHCIGTWSVDTEAEAKLTLTAENDPDSRIHCALCGENIRAPAPGQDICTTCAPKAARP